MTEADFITETEIRELMGVAKQTLSNIRSQDHTFPKPCRGKIRRYPRREFFNWYMNRGRAA